MNVKRIALHLVVWLVVFVFWLSSTRQYHPTPALAALATAVLVGASATAVYVNTQLLLPRFARRRLWWFYAASLLATVAVLDLTAVLSIQMLYDWLWGPDPGRFGFLFNVSSDGSIIALHVVASVVVIWFVRFLRQRIANAA